MKIGLISDTHGWLDPKVFDHFEQCDEVWHVGDIGDPALLTALSKFKQLRAVHGNIDGKEIRNECPEIQQFTCERLTVWMIHIAGNPPLYTAQVRALLSQGVPDVLVCGHSHILRVMHDIKHPPLLFLNPGAAGRHGFHHIRTLLRFEIHGKKMSNMEVVELGTRAQLI
ncbi:metallophosphoesterase family protein [Cardinium endosymbiont of Tipula unca]|uniref:metallophosphoesterase family protein n=1 Tax=Cardinium endosymbiont of Tipula unca TaxID=3066216 RepID=UPI0030D5FED0